LSAHAVLAAPCPLTHTPRQEHGDAPPRRRGAQTAGRALPEPLTAAGHQCHARTCHRSSQRPPRAAATVLLAHATRPSASAVAARPRARSSASLLPAPAPAALPIPFHRRTHPCPLPFLPRCPKPCPEPSAPLRPAQKPAAAAFAAANTSPWSPCSRPSSTRAHALASFHTFPGSSTNPPLLPGATPRHRTRPSPLDAQWPPPLRGGLCSGRSLPKRKAPSASTCPSEPPRPDLAAPPSPERRRRHSRPPPAPAHRGRCATARPSAHRDHLRVHLEPLILFPHFPFAAGE